MQSLVAPIKDHLKSIGYWGVLESETSNFNAHPDAYRIFVYTQKAAKSIILPRQYVGYFATIMIWNGSIFINSHVFHKGHTQNHSFDSEAELYDPNTNVIKFINDSLRTIVREYVNVKIY